MITRTIFLNKKSTASIYTIPTTTLASMTTTTKTKTTRTASSRRNITTSTSTMMIRRGRRRPTARSTTGSTQKMLYIAAAAAFSTSTTTQAWLLTTDISGSRSSSSSSRSSSSSTNLKHHYNLNYGDQRRQYGLSSASSLFATPIVSASSLSPSSLLPTYTRASSASTSSSSSSSSRTATRLYSSSRFRPGRNNNDNDNNNGRKKKELFGFRRAAKRVAKKVLPAKWFASEEEIAKLERKQQVKDRVQGELDQMLKNAPLPIRMLGKYVAAPMMGKIASKVAEASEQQRETNEKILDEARTYLLNDPEISDLLGTPIQLGTPHSQRSAVTIINGKRQLQTEFAVEVSGPNGNGVSRVLASNEGVGQLLVEANGKVYNIDLTSKGRMSGSSSSSSSSSRGSSRMKNKGVGGSASSSFNDDNIIEAEIIDKETK